VGLKSGGFALSFLFLTSALQAAPMLRLVSATVGPVPASVGVSPAPQTLEAYNLGDGTLSLSLSSSAPWVTATAGTTRACVNTTAARNCIPLQFVLNTGSLAAGTYTGIVTVSDANAVDAPQTVTVTVRVGPVDLHAAPGMTRDTMITTASVVNAQTTTNDGTGWLKLVLDGTGSFRFSYPYRIRMQPPAGMAAGVYDGVVTTSSASVSADNLRVPVTMRVTTQPIAQASPESLEYRLAQGAPAGTTAIAVSNAGLGSLTIQSVSASGSGISAAKFDGGAYVTFDAGALATGVYNGSVTISTSAVNGTLTVPARFEVVAKAAPRIRYQGVVDNGTFSAGDAGARGDIMVIMGEQFSFAPLTVGKAPPLDMQVGGATVLVNGKPAPMYYSSYGQLAFQMPVDAPLGTVQVQTQRDLLTSNTVTVEVAERAPRLLLVGTTGFGAIYNQDYSIPMPETAIPGVYTRPAHPGETLTFYAIGLGPTSPVVATGAPSPSAEPFARLTAVPQVNFGGGVAGAIAIPVFAGLSPGFAGLYQLNVTIPDNTPKGNVSVSVAFPDAVSNSVLVAIQ
jgi:uncharacterized protein (TIGR03437 family)